LFARKGSFTGEIHAQSGTLGNLTVIGSIQAGYTTISSAGIDIQSGSINLGNGRFIVEPDGSMTASQATIVGQITATTGQFLGPVTAGGSVTLSDEGVHVHGAGGLMVQAERGIEVSGGSIAVLHPQSGLPLVLI